MIIIYNLGKFYNGNDEQQINFLHPKNYLVYDITQIFVTTSQTNTNIEISMFVFFHLL